MSKRLLFGLAAVLAASGIWFSYQNHQQAGVQAAAIIKADSLGQDTVAAINNLKLFVGSHMGSGVNFTLQAAYERAQAQARVAAQAAAGTSRVYADAQAACAGKSDSVTQARCNQSYLAKHLTAMPQPTPVATPKLADYQYIMRAPIWSPDLAGALLAGALAALVVGLAGLRRRGH
jgi:hypothetical protein